MQSCNAPVAAPSIRDFGIILSRRIGRRNFQHVGALPSRSNLRRVRVPVGFWPHPCLPAHARAHAPATSTGLSATHAIIENGSTHLLRSEKASASLPAHCVCCPNPNSRYLSPRCTPPWFRRQSDQAPFPSPCRIPGRREAVPPSSASARASTPTLTPNYASTRIVPMGRECSDPSPASAASISHREGRPLSWGHGRH